VPRDLGWAIHNLEQYWRRQPRAAAMRKHQSGDVGALDSQTLRTTATCFQCDGDGRRSGLKIRSSKEGVGSSPTFVPEGCHVELSVWPEVDARRVHVAGLWSPVQYHHNLTDSDFRLLIGKPDTAGGI
jgi:hypothetical protein